jgi:hypothetical protein
MCQKFRGYPSNSRLVIESMEAVTCMGHILRTYMGHMARAREHGGCETSRPMPCDTSGPPMEALSLSLSLSHTHTERERERETSRPMPQTPEW